MTKTDVLAARVGGNHIVDFHLGVGDDDPVDQQPDQLALLLEAGVIQSGAYAGAEVLDRDGGFGELLMPIGLGGELAFLFRQRLITLFQVATPSLVLGQGNDIVQIGFGQAINLLAQADATLAQVLPARLQRLWQPVPTVRALQRPRELGRMGEHFAQVAPHQLVELAGGRKAGMARLAPQRCPFDLARTHVVRIGRTDRGAADTGIAAIAATDQRPQQVGVRGVVATREALILRQLGLHQLELLGGHDGRHRRHRDPFGGWHRDAARMRSAHRAGRRTPDAGRAVTYSSSIDLAGVGGIRQDPVQGGHRPRRLAARRRYMTHGQRTRQLQQAHLGLQIQRKDFRHHRRLAGLQDHSARVARPVGMKTVTVGRPRPGQQHPGAQLGQTAAAHPLGD